MKKGFLKTLRNLQEKTCLTQSLFLNKVAGLRSATLFKKDSGTGVFP